MPLGFGIWSSLEGIRWQCMPAGPGGAASLEGISTGASAKSLPVRWACGGPAAAAAAARAPPRTRRAPLRAHAVRRAFAAPRKNSHAARRPQAAGRRPPSPPHRPRAHQPPAIPAAPPRHQRRVGVHPPERAVQGVRRHGRHPRERVCHLRRPPPRTDLPQQALPGRGPGAAGNAGAHTWWSRPPSARAAVCSASGPPCGVRVDTGPTLPPPPGPHS
jgi:hypothetical protein